MVEATFHIIEIAVEIDIDIGIHIVYLLVVPFFTSSFNATYVLSPSALVLKLD